MMRDSMAAGSRAAARSLALVAVVAFAADNSCLSSLRNSARTAREDWVTTARPAFSARAARCGRARSSSTDGISRRRAEGLGCSFAAGSAGGVMAKVFEHSAIRAGNRRRYLLCAWGFPFATWAETGKLTLGAGPSTLEIPGHCWRVANFAGITKTAGDFGYGHNRRRPQPDRT